MPITHSDRISGTIYVIATSADEARELAIDYWRDKTESYGVYDHQADADKELHNRHSSYDPDQSHVYAISLDVRIADEK